MSLINHTATGPDHPRPRTHAERELARALALLESDPAGSVTLAALREQGVKAPAQAVYDLQIAGYAIDRVTSRHAGGQTSPGYRLRGPAPPTPDPPAGSRETDHDHD
jgi:hypothetical protein